MGEVLPKATYRLYAEELLLRTDILIQFFRVLFFPITWLVRGFAKLLEVYFGVLPMDEGRFDRAHMSLNLGHAFSGGELSKEQVESLSQVMNVSDYPVERSMLPLHKAPLVSIQATLDELREVYLTHPEKAYAVYEGKKTNIVGTVNVHKLVLSSGVSKRPIKQALMPKMSLEVGKTFREALPLFFEKNASLVFITRNKKVIGTITWKSALLLLLR
jgi:CBS domain containing-hemolysin-like protein